MEESKLDPTLIRFLEEDDGEAVVRVFVRVTRQPTDAEAESAGLDPRLLGHRVLTLSANLADIESLSEEPWVSSVILGTELHPRRHLFRPSGGSTPR
jgi:hypothetical protein